MYFLNLICDQEEFFNVALPSGVHVGLAPDTQSNCEVNLFSMDASPVYSTLTRLLFAVSLLSLVLGIVSLGVFLVIRSDSYTPLIFASIFAISLRAAYYLASKDNNSLKSQ